MERGCGIYLPISALPNKYGYGSFSKEVFEFIDYISGLGIKYWQIEPLNLCHKVSCETISFYAGNPLYIDLEKYLVKEELDFFKLNENLSFEEYSQKKREALSYLVDKLYLSTNIDKFIEQNETWVYDFAVFMALKDELQCEYKDFPDELKNTDSGETISFIKTHSEEIISHIFLQYIFFKQWREIKKYANLRGVKIITETSSLPSNDSADVYANKRLFTFNNKLEIDETELVRRKYDYFVDRLKFYKNIYDYTILEINDKSYFDDKFFEILKSNNLKNIIIDNNNYLGENKNKFNKKCKYLDNNNYYKIKNIMSYFTGESSESLVNDTDTNKICYLGVKQKSQFNEFLKNSILREKFSNYFNIDISSSDDIFFKVALDNLMSLNYSVVIVNTKDLLFTEEINHENNNFGFKLNKKYKENALFLYLSELIKNKNR